MARDGTYPLRYIPTISRPGDPRNAGWDGRTGRVEAVVADVCRDLDLRPERTVVYICGNPEMIKVVSGMLEGKGFTRSQGKNPGNIHVEEYW